MHSFRRQLIKIQRAVYLRNLRKIKQSLAYDDALDGYSREYHRYLKTYKAIVPPSVLVKQVLASDIVYHGDYHPLKQSQRSVLRVLREIAGKRDLLLCLEMFHSTDQAIVDSFMNDELSQNDFLIKIDYKKKWEYRYEYWKPIIDLCKQYQVPIFGINSTHHEKRSLFSRDESAAIIIGTLALRNPGRLIYVVDGDYHISPAHLPARVDEKLNVFGVTPKKTIIYQNDANLYWQLAAERNEDADVLQIDDSSFCIINTTPANKLQSYLNWLDFSEDAYNPMHSEWEDLSEESGNTTIPGIVKTICTIIGLPYPEEALARLEIYYGNHHDFMGIISGTKNLVHLLPQIRRKIKLNEGFMVEYDKESVRSYLIYLPNSSLNIAAEEATHFLHSVTRGIPVIAASPFDAFYTRVLTEAIGFFGSKLINERRKAQTINGIKRFLRNLTRSAQPLTREDRQKAALSRLLLRHRRLERLSHEVKKFKKKFMPVYKDRSGLSTEFATQLGYMLGNRLFYAVKSRKRPLKEVGALFLEKCGEPGRAFGLYCALSIHRKDRHGARV